MWTHARARVSGQLLHDGAWVVGGQVLSAIAALGTLRVLTELLTPKEYGRLALLLGASGLTLGICVTPKLQAILRYYSDWSRIGEIPCLRRVGVRSVRGGVASGSIALIGGWFALSLAAGQPWYTGLLVAALVVVDTIRSFELVLLNAARRQRTYNIILATDAFARPFAGVLAIVLFRSSADYALLGYILGSAGIIAVMRGRVRLEGVGKPTGNFATRNNVREMELAQSISVYARPLLPVAIFGWVNGIGDRYVIGALLGLDAAGLYSAAYGVVSRPFLMVSSVVEQLYRPIFHDAIAAEDYEKTGAVKRAWVWSVALGSALGVISFIYLSGLSVGLLLGAEYRPVVPLMPWIAVGAGFFNLTLVYTRFCYGFNDTWRALEIIGGGAAVTLVVLVPATYLFGLTGAAVANTMYFGAQAGLAILLSRRSEMEYTRSKKDRSLRHGS